MAVDPTPIVKSKNLKFFRLFLSDEIYNMIWKSEKNEIVINEKLRSIPSEGWGKNNHIYRKIDRRKINKKKSLFFVQNNFFEKKTLGKKSKNTIYYIINRSSESRISTTYYSSKTLRRLDIYFHVIQVKKFIKVI